MADGVCDEAASLNLQGLGLVSLDGMPVMPVLQVLNIADNLLSNFYGIPTQPALRVLDASNNGITSLLGMSHQPSIEAVRLDSNPLCSHPHFRIMVILACGETVANINGRPVTEDERRVVRLLGGSGGWAARCISFGWTELSPDDAPDRSPDEYEMLINELKIHYVAAVRSLDRNYSFSAVMARRGPLPLGAAASSSRKQQQLCSPGADDPSPLHNRRHVKLHYGEEPSSRRDESHSPPRDHSKKVQLTLDDLRAFYRRSPTTTPPLGADSAHSTDKLSQQRPLGLELHDTLHHPIPSHYSAIDAARRYAEHYRQTGTVIGADVMDVFPAQSSSAGRRRLGRGANDAREAATLPSPSSSAAALVLMQKEVGCLSGVDIDNVDVVIVDRGTTHVTDALCRVVGATTLHVLENGRIVYSVDLLSAQDIFFDRDACGVRIIVDDNFTTGRDTAREVVVTVQETAGSRDAREAMARGMFKILMLFKCTPEELEALYAATVIRH